MNRATENMGHQKYQHKCNGSSKRKRTEEVTEELSEAAMSENLPNLMKNTHLPSSTNPRIKPGGYHLDTLQPNT